MVTLEQIKALVIKSETEWLIEVHDGDKFLPNFINGMKDEINECENIQDIALFYARSRDDDFEEGLLTVLSIIRNNCVIKEALD
jgi:hypothetical protein